MQKTYRQVAVGADADNAVTVGIERNAQGQLIAAVWWPSKADMDADEAEYGDVAAALAAAEASRELHGFAEVVVTIQSDDLWQDQWGQLAPLEPSREPIGDISGTDLSDREALSLAQGIEAERDA